MSMEYNEKNTSQTRIAGVAMVKDECDIIELFVRINSRHVDHLFIVDHNSRDNTRLILTKLMEEGLPLTVLGHGAFDFQQAIVITSLVRQIAHSGEYEYIVPLDADEFINPLESSFSAILKQKIPQGKCGLMKWETYVPLEDTYFSSDSPLFHLFKKRNPEEPQYEKIIISRDVALNCSVGEGNHHAVLNDKLVDALPINATLQHVPVRSSAQIIRKALIGSHRLSIKKGRQSFEGYHWDNIAATIRTNGYELPYSKLRDIALNYAAPSSNDTQRTVAMESMRIGLISDRIIYRNLAVINTLKSLDEFSADLCNAYASLNADYSALNEIAASLRAKPSLINRLLRIDK